MPEENGNAAEAGSSPASADGANERTQALCRRLEEQSALIEKDIAYYDDLYARAKWRSVALKGIAIVAFVIGALTPVLDDLLGDPQGYDLLAIGFLALTLAGLALGLDRAMMISSNRLNFNKALVELNLLKRGFEIDRSRFDWLASGEKDPAALADQVFEAMREMEAARVAILRAESEAWSTGYEASIAELKAQISSASQETRTALSERTTREDERRISSRPGFVTLRFSPADKPDVEVAIGTAKRRVPATTNPAVVEDVPPGTRRMTVVWERDGREQSLERVLEVAADGATEVAVDLDQA